MENKKNLKKKLMIIMALLAVAIVSVAGIVAFTQNKQKSTFADNAFTFKSSNMTATIVPFTSKYTTENYLDVYSVPNNKIVEFKNSKSI